MTTIKQSVISWLLLIGLTLLSTFVGELIEWRWLSIICVMLIVLYKGQQVTDVFMELAHGPKEWRWLLLSYIAIVPGVIALIYIIAS